MGSSTKKATTASSSNGRVSIKMTIYENATPDVFNAIANIPTTQRTKLLQELMSRGMRAANMEKIHSQAFDEIGQSTRAVRESMQMTVGATTEIQRSLLMAFQKMQDLTGELADTVAGKVLDRLDSRGIFSNDSASTGSKPIPSRGTIEPVVDELSLKGISQEVHALMQIDWVEKF